MIDEAARRDEDDNVDDDERDSEKDRECSRCDEINERK